MRLKCRENLDVLVEEHPYHERLNNSILEESLSFNFSRDSQGNVYGTKTQENNVCARSIDIVIMIFCEVILQRQITTVGIKGHHFITEYR